MSDMWSNSFSLVLAKSDSKSFKIVQKFICPILLLLAGGVMLYLALFYYLWIIIADQSMSFHGQVGRIIGQISILASSAVCQSSGHCAILKKTNRGGWGYTSLKTTWNF